MTVIEVKDRLNDFQFPNDDGKMKRPWIKNPDERGNSGEVRVWEVLSARPWLISEAVISEKNGHADWEGVDVYALVNEDLLSVLGIEQGEEGIGFQSKSSEKTIRSYVSHHKARGQIFSINNHVFVLNGQDAKMLILADIVGQMVVLANNNGVEEEVLLMYLEQAMGDSEAVGCFRLNREIVVESRWYGKLLAATDEE